MSPGRRFPPPSSRAPRVALAPKSPFPFPFKRLPRRLYLYRGRQTSETFKTSSINTGNKADASNVRRIRRLKLRWLNTVSRAVAMETTKTSNFTCQSKHFIIIFFTCQVLACELQPFSCHNLANDLYSETAKTVFSHLKCVRSTHLTDELVVSDV